MRNFFSSRLHNRILAGITALVMLVIVAALFRLCIIEAADETSLYVNTGATYTTKVGAARGLIYDTKGRPLVSNEIAYSIVFRYPDWKRDDQNTTILRLIDIMNARGETYSDTLPVTFAPYHFMGTMEHSARRNLKKFLERINWNTSITADTLMSRLYERYKLTDSEFTEEERRVIAGVRYEMELREFSYAGTFTFAEEVSAETIAIIKENSFTFPGVDVDVTEQRAYETSYAAHVLGRVGMIYAEEYAELKELGYSMDARIGKDGAEKAFENYLRGTDGKLRITKDIHGSTIGESYDVEPHPGENVFLTLDLALQEVTENAMADRIEEIKKLSETKSSYPADIAGGAAVVMEVNTGRILAQASYPTYSLLSFNADYNDLLKDELTPMLNRTIGAIYPPASTFKMVSAVAGLENKIVSAKTKLPCDGIYTFYKDYRPKCWYYSKYGHGHGDLNVAGAISNSCNCYFFEVGRLLGIETIERYAREFGFGSKTGIELSGEVSGWISCAETKKTLTGEIWYPGDVLQTAIGQSYTMVTPLQLCTYISAIANGGTVYRPTILDKVTTHDNTEVVYKNSAESYSKVEMSAATRNAVVQGMLNVTEDGTASSAFRDVTFEVAGKTGSAQVPNGSDNAVFAAFAPVKNPEIAVVVIVEHGNSGNSIAPIARTIFEAYFDTKTDTGSISGTKIPNN
ncbi:MAG: hypothetical protein J6S59_01765 [Clostridia bacterium]|nr:hypothetical protein [Clostridia bacterium]